MPVRSVVGEHAADFIGLEVRVRDPWRSLGLGGIRKRPVALSLMRWLLVKVREIILKCALQAAPRPMNQQRRRH